MRCTSRKIGRTGACRKATTARTRPSPRWSAWRTSWRRKRRSFGSITTRRSATARRCRPSTTSERAYACARWRLRRARPRLRARRGASRDGPRAERLSKPPGDAGRALSGRRHRRPSVPLRRRQGEQQSRRAGRGREPSGRRGWPRRHRAVLRAPPDGYTLLCAAQLTFSVTHLLFSKASFDPRALEPVSVLATYPLILIARADLPFNNLQDLIAYARANPGKINYGHQGKGQTGHLLGELLMLKGEFRMTEIPYRGSAPAINDLLAGNIDVVPDYLLANKANIDAGKLKLLATGSRERLKDYPRVATIAATLPGVYADTWMAVAAPPGTPKEIAKKVSEAIRQGFQESELRAHILALEAHPLASTPQEMRELIHQSLETWRPVVEAAKIVVE